MVIFWVLVILPFLNSRKFSLIKFHENDNCFGSSLKEDLFRTGVILDDECYLNPFSSLHFRLSGCDGFIRYYSTQEDCISQVSMLFLQSYVGACLSYSTEYEEFGIVRFFQVGECTEMGSLETLVKVFREPDFVEGCNSAPVFHFMFNGSCQLEVVEGGMESSKLGRADISDQSLFWAEFSSRDCSGAPTRTISSFAPDCTYFYSNYLLGDNQGPTIDYRIIVEQSFNTDNITCFGQYNPTACSQNHGYCIENDVCVCGDGFYGTKCENEATCNGIGFLNQTSCSGNGYCLEVEHCECLFNYYGNICEEEVSCFGIKWDESEVCSGKGTCVGIDECSCFPDWGVADDCSVIMCNGVLSNDTNVCSGHGFCAEKDFCFCENGFFSTIEGNCVLWDEDYQLGFKQEMFDENDQSCVGNVVSEIWYLDQKVMFVESFQQLLILHLNRMVYSFCDSLECLNPTINNLPPLDMCLGAQIFKSVEYVNLTNNVENSLILKVFESQSSCDVLSLLYQQHVLNDQCINNVTSIKCNMGVLEGANYTANQCSGGFVDDFKELSDEKCHKNMNTKMKMMFECSSYGEIDFGITCAGISHANGLVCNGHGICRDVDICECERGYFSTLDGHCVEMDDNYELGLIYEQFSPTCPDSPISINFLFDQRSVFQMPNDDVLIKMFLNRNMFIENCNLDYCNYWNLTTATQLPGLDECVPMGPDFYMRWRKANFSKFVEETMQLNFVYETLLYDSQTCGANLQNGLSIFGNAGSMCIDDKGYSCVDNDLHVNMYDGGDGQCNGNSVPSESSGCVDNELVNYYVQCYVGDFSMNNSTAGNNETYDQEPIPPYCKGIASNFENVCNGKGTCIQTDFCNCIHGYSSSLDGSCFQKSTTFENGISMTYYHDMSCMDENMNMMKLWWMDQETVKYIPTNSMFLKFFVERSMYMDCSVGFSCENGTPTPLPLDGSCLDGGGTYLKFTPMTYSEYFSNTGMGNVMYNDYYDSPECDLESDVIPINSFSSPVPMCINEYLYTCDMNNELQTEQFMEMGSCNGESTFISNMGCLPEQNMYANLYYDVGCNGNNPCGDNPCMCDPCGELCISYNPTTCYQVNNIIPVSTYYCYSINASSPSVCSGNGNCVSYDECVCDFGWEGEDCSTEVICQNECNGQGVCVSTDICYCNDGYIPTYSGGCLIFDFEADDQGIFANHYCDIDISVGFQFVNAAVLVLDGWYLNGECLTPQNMYATAYASFKYYVFDDVENFMAYKIQFTSTVCVLETDPPNFRVQVFRNVTENDPKGSCVYDLDEKMMGNGAGKKMHVTKTNSQFVVSNEGNENIVQKLFKNGDCADSGIVHIVLREDPSLCLPLMGVFVNYVCLNSTHTKNTMYSINENDCLYMENPMNQMISEVSTCQSYYGNLYTNQVIECKDRMFCYGFQSESKLVCSGNGECTETDNCKCNEGFYGSKCDIFLCNGILSNDSSVVCSGNGKCVKTDICDCNDESYAKDGTCVMKNDGYEEGIYFDVYNNKKCLGERIEKKFYEFGFCHELFTGFSLKFIPNELYYLRCDEGCNNCFLVDIYYYGDCAAGGPYVYQTFYQGNYSSSKTERESKGITVLETSYECDKNPYQAIFGDLGFGKCISTQIGGFKIQCYNSTFLRKVFFEAKDCSGLFKDFSFVKHDECITYGNSSSTSVCDAPICYGLENPLACGGDRGFCFDDSFCVCNEGFFGDECGNDDWKCNDIYRMNPNACSGHGSCEESGNCTCFNRFSGGNCEIEEFRCSSYYWDEPEVCNGKGTCSDMYGYPECLCFGDYWGNECEYTSCFGIPSYNDNVCSAGGTCIDYNNCKCDNEHWGLECNVFKCFGVFNNDSSVCGDGYECIDIDDCEMICPMSQYGESCGYYSIGTPKSRDIENYDGFYYNSIMLSGVYLHAKFQFTIDKFFYDCDYYSNGSPFKIAIYQSLTPNINEPSLKIVWLSEEYNSLNCYRSKQEMMISSSTVFDGGFYYYVGFWTSGYASMRNSKYELTNYFGHNTQYNSSIEIPQPTGWYTVHTYSLLFGIDISPIEIICFNKSNIHDDSNVVCNGHGACISNDNCTCFVGWSGYNCTQEEYMCNGTYKSNPFTCNGHGSCISEDTCVCDLHFSGEFCKIEEQKCDSLFMSDPNLCGGEKKGYCYVYNEGRYCSCYYGYGGYDCKDHICFDIWNYEDHVCNSHGICYDYDRCLCLNGTQGPKCDFVKCNGIISYDEMSCGGPNYKCVLEDTCELSCERNSFGTNCEKHIIGSYSQMDGSRNTWMDEIYLSGEYYDVKFSFTLEKFLYKCEYSSYGNNFRIFLYRSSSNNYYDIFEIAWSSSELQPVNCNREQNEIIISDPTEIPPGIYFLAYWSNDYVDFYKSNTDGDYPMRRSYHMYDSFNAPVVSNWNYDDQQSFAIGVEISPIVDYCNGKSAHIDPLNEICSGNGFCINGNCTCNLGFEGDNCDDKYGCFGKVYDDVNVCSGNGECLSWNNCSCNIAFYGSSCQFSYCGEFKSGDIEACNGQGWCDVNGECSQCDENYGGDYCNFYLGCQEDNEYGEDCTKTLVGFMVDSSSVYVYNFFNKRVYVHGIYLDAFYYFSLDIFLYQCFSYENGVPARIILYKANDDSYLTISSPIWTSNEIQLVCNEKIQTIDLSFVPDIFSPGVYFLGIWSSNYLYFASKNDGKSFYEEYIGYYSSSADAPILTPSNFYQRNYNYYAGITVNPLDYNGTCFGKSSSDINVCGVIGKCVAENECYCGGEGYYGTECENFDCFGSHFSSPNVCGGIGDCLGPNNCSCAGNYDPVSGCVDCVSNYELLTNCTKEKQSCYGIYYDEIFNVCSGVGSCISQNNCTCPIEKYGLQCEYTKCYGYKPSDPEACNGHGICETNGLCTCNANWGGSSDCDYYECPGYHQYGESCEEKAIGNVMRSNIYGHSHVSGNYIYLNSEYYELISYFSLEKYIYLCYYNYNPNVRVILYRTTSSNINDIYEMSWVSEEFSLECDENPNEIDLTHVHQSFPPGKYFIAMWRSSGGYLYYSYEDNGFPSYYIYHLYHSTNDPPLFSDYSINPVGNYFYFSGIITQPDGFGNLTCFGIDFTNENVCSAHGTCINLDECFCGNYYGTQCENWNCYGISSLSYQVCGGMGTCSEYNTCECPNYFDPSSGCTVCLYNYDISSNCTVCINNYNISTECTVCNENYEMLSDCVNCINRYDVDNNCEICEENFDILSNCINCTDSRYAGYQCDTPICYGKVGVQNMSVFFDDFESKDASKWVEIMDTGIVISSGTERCGSDSGNAVSFHGGGVRSLTTNMVFETRDLIEISFWIVLGRGRANGLYQGCESTDGGEQVALEIIEKVSGTIHEVMIFDPYYNNNEPDVVSISVIPPLVGFTVRFIQYSHSGSCCDHWAIDSFMIRGEGLNMKSVMQISNACSYPLGQCTSPNHCTCNEGYFGKECKIPSCYGVLANETACSGHGECVAKDECFCVDGYDGLECNFVASCFGIEANNTNVCSGKGICFRNDNCTCDDGYYGEECEKWNCFGVLYSDSNTCNSQSPCFSPNNCSCYKNYDFLTGCSTCIGSFELETNCTGCINHYNISSGCTVCDENWDIDHDCSICVGSYYGYNFYDDEKDCITCLNNFDINTDCSQCRTHYYHSIFDGCLNCITGWDIEKDCDECLPGYNPLTSCSSCKTNYDINNNCETCINHYSLSSNCTECKEHFEPLSDCTVCTGNYDIYTECMTCLNRYALSFDCSVCEDGFDIQTDCKYCEDYHFTGDKCDIPVCYGKAFVEGGFYLIEDDFEFKNFSNWIDISSPGIDILPACGSFSGNALVMKGVNSENKRQLTSKMIEIVHSEGVEYELSFWIVLGGICDRPEYGEGVKVFMIDDNGETLLQEFAYNYNNYQPDNVVINFVAYNPFQIVFKQNIFSCTTDCDMWGIDNFKLYFAQACSYPKGICDNGVCNCLNNWSGEQCNDPSCFGIGAGNSSVCNGKGECFSIDNCLCDSGYDGYDCNEIAFCNGMSNINTSVCSGRGQCFKNDNCTCNEPEKYYGNDCQFWSCFGKRNDDPDSCFGKVPCVEPDVCNCGINYGSGDCSECLYMYDIDSNCEVCSGLYDISTNCTRCLDRLYSGENCDIPLCYGNVGLSSYEPLNPNVENIVFFDDFEFRDPTKWLEIGNENDIVMSNGATYCGSASGSAPSFRAPSIRKRSLTTQVISNSRFFVEREEFEYVLTFWFVIGRSGFPDCDPAEINEGVYIIKIEEGDINGEDLHYLPYNYNNNQPDEVVVKFTALKDFQIKFEQRKYQQSYSDHWSIDNVLIEQMSACNYPDGECWSIDNCDCKDGYYGSECQFPKCFGILSNNSLVCSGHGECIEHNECQCNVGWKTYNCSKAPETCDDHQYCMNGICSVTDYVRSCACFNGYSGYNCTVKRKCFDVDFDNPMSCSNHGECVDDNNCQCNVGYEKTLSNDCSVKRTCYNVDYDSASVCSNHGDCVAKDVCYCNFGYELLSDCSHKRKCFGFEYDDIPNVCSNNGICVFEDECQCNTGFEKLGNCSSVRSCFGYLFNDYSNVCSGHGNCVGEDLCSCNYGYNGTECEGKFACYGVWAYLPESCSNHGVCLFSGECNCDYGWTTSSDCNQRVTCYGKDFQSWEVCSDRNGYCPSHDQCDCYYGYVGKECESWTCYGLNHTHPDVCSGNGECVGYNNCQCNTNYYGKITGYMCQVVPTWRFFPPEKLFGELGDELLLFEGTEFVDFFPFDNIHLNLHIKEPIIFDETLIGVYTSYGAGKYEIRFSKNVYKTNGNLNYRIYSQKVIEITQYEDYALPLVNNRYDFEFSKHYKLDRNCTIDGCYFAISNSYFNVLKRVKNLRVAIYGDDEYDVDASFESSVPLRVLEGDVLCESSFNNGQFAFCDFEGDHPFYYLGYVIYCDLVNSTEKFAFDGGFFTDEYNNKTYHVAIDEEDTVIETDFDIYYHVPGEDIIYQEGTEKIPIEFDENTWKANFTVEIFVVSEEYFVNKMDELDIKWDFVESYGSGGLLDLSIDESGLNVSAQIGVDFHNITDACYNISIYYIGEIIFKKNYCIGMQASKISDYSAVVEEGGLICNESHISMNETYLIDVEGKSGLSFGKRIILHTLDCVQVVMDKYNLTLNGTSNAFNRSFNVEEIPEAYYIKLTSDPIKINNMIYFTYTFSSWERFYNYLLISSFEITETEVIEPESRRAIERTHGIFDFFKKYKKLKKIGSSLKDILLKAGKKAPGILWQMTGGKIDISFDTKFDYTFKVSTKKTPELWKYMNAIYTKVTKTMVIGAEVSVGITISGGVEVNAGSLNVVKDKLEVPILPQVNFVPFLFFAIPFTPPIPVLVSAFMGCDAGLSVGLKGSFSVNVDYEIKVHGEIRYERNKYINPDLDHYLFGAWEHFLPPKLTKNFGAKTTRKSMYGSWGCGLSLEAFVSPYVGVDFWLPFPLEIKAAMPYKWALAAEKSDKCCEKDEKYLEVSGKAGYQYSLEAKVFGISLPPVTLTFGGLFGLNDVFPSYCVSVLGLPVNWCCDSTCAQKHGEEYVKCTSDHIFRGKVAAKDKIKCCKDKKPCKETHGPDYEKCKQKTENCVWERKEVCTFYNYGCIRGIAYFVKKCSPISPTPAKPGCCLIPNDKAPPSFYWGDPHLSTLNGISYSYYGVGDFVMLRSPLFEYEARFEATFSSTASGVTAIAARTIESDSIAIHHVGDFQLKRYVNDEEVEFGGCNEFGACDFVGYYNGVGVRLYLDKIIFDSGTEIRYTAQRSHIDIVQTISRRNFGVSMGLLGAWDSTKSNDFMIPSGEVLTKDDINIFAEAWRLCNLKESQAYTSPWLEKDSLLHYDEGKELCYYDDVDFEALQDLSEIDPTIVSLAEQVCAGVSPKVYEGCVYDSVIALEFDDSLSIDDVLSSVNRTTHDINNILPPRPPLFLTETHFFVPKGHFFNETIVVDDPDGDDVVIFEMISEIKGVTFELLSATEAILTWNNPPVHERQIHEIFFNVEDNTALSDTISLTIEFEDRCPSGGELSTDGKCFYSFPGVRMNWQDARLYCKENFHASSDIPIIESEAQVLAFRHATGHRRAWILLSDAYNHGEWMWMDGDPADESTRTPYNYTNWKMYRPKVGKGHCAYQHYKLVWLNHYCHSKMDSVTCAFDTTGEHPGEVDSYSSNVWLNVGWKFTGNFLDFSDESGFCDFTNDPNDCPKKFGSCESNCSSHGDCMFYKKSKKNYCSCHTGYEGALCEIENILYGSIAQYDCVGVGDFCYYRFPNKKLKWEAARRYCKKHWDQAADLAIIPDYDAQVVVSELCGVKGCWIGGVADITYTGEEFRFDWVDHSGMDFYNNWHQLDSGGDHGESCVAMETNVPPFKSRWSTGNCATHKHFICGVKLSEGGVDTPGESGDPWINVFYENLNSPLASCRCGSNSTCCAVECGGSISGCP